MNDTRAVFYISSSFAALFLMRVCESEKDYFMKILSKYEIKKEKNLLND